MHIQRNITTQNAGFLKGTRLTKLFSEGGGHVRKMYVLKGSEFKGKKKTEKFLVKLL